MLDPEIKAKWLAALRSGEYPQGKFKLLRDGKYCCFGVLFELAIPEEKYPDGNCFFFSGREGGKFRNFDEIVAYLGIEDYLTLIDMNDGNNPENKSYSFSEIADYIEANL